MAAPTFSISPALEYYLTSIEIKRAGYIKAFEFFAVSSGSATIKVFKKKENCLNGSFFFLLIPSMYKTIFVKKLKIIIHIIPC